MSEFNNIIKEICNELDIKLTFLSDNWVMILEKDNKIKYIEGNHFSINNQTIGNIMDDKGLFYDLMIYKNYPIIKHKVIFKETNKEEIINYFNENNQEIIVKANIGSCGKEVFLVNNQDELLNLTSKLFINQYSLSLCPYYDILHEYRAIILNGECKLIYGKRRPLVIGNGKSSLLELAKNFNNEYFSKIENQTFDINYIPKKDEEVLLNFQFNLSKGSISFLEIDSNLKDKIINLAKNVANDLDIKFASIDIIETINHELLIMEANSGVTISKFINQHKGGYNITYNIYKDAIIEMLKE